MKILHIKQNNIYLPTGNEQVSIPTLFTDGSIENINVISMRHRGLFELCGEQHKPLIRPYIRVNGQPVTGLWTWEREAYWIPKFIFESDEVILSGEICAPVGERGFYYKLEVKNKTKDIQDIELGLEGWWLKTLHTVNESKEVNAKPTAFRSGWNESILFELVGEIPLLAFAPMTNKKLDIIDLHLNNDNKEIYYKLLKNVLLNSTDKQSICFFWGIGLEEVGAATAAKEMLRKGQENVRNHTLNWIRKRIKTTGEQELDEAMNLNLLFNYFFATGQTIDTEEDVLVTSRSPRYYVSAAYWDRDSLLWSFPAVLVIDPKRAKRMLDYVFTTQKKNIGIHSRYIDGVVLEPGFELDELCAPILALDMYLKETNDWAYIQKTYVQESLEQIVENLIVHKHDTINLYDTFLQPTDDPIVYPFLTYNNVLVWKMLKILSRLSKEINLSYESSRFEQMALQVREAIYQHMVVEEDGERFFVWSVDLQGNYNIYDEPPGSLQLLPYYGFCSFDDEVYKNTVKVIRSEKNVYSFKGCVFEELGCAHAEHPWVLSVANSFLSGRENEARDFIIRAPLDGGIACESIDEHIGVPRTGEHFATCAGFLAYAIYYAFGKGREINE